MTVPYFHPLRGHNGVRSCVDCLHTDVSQQVFSRATHQLKWFAVEIQYNNTCWLCPQVMPRLRIGIGRPSGKTTVDRYVLGRFSQEEHNVLDSVMKQSVDFLLTYITDSQPQTSPAEGRRASRKNKARTLSPPQDTTEEQKQNWPTHDNCISFLKELSFVLMPRRGKDTVIKDKTITYISA